MTREQIEDTVHGQVMGNFLTVDLEAVRNTFGKLPWVRDCAGAPSLAAEPGGNAGGTCGAGALGRCGTGE